MIRKLILAAVMTATSAIAFAGEQVWDFPEDTNINNTGLGAQVVISNTAGENVTVTAWSSTGDGCGTVTGNSGTNDTDSCIENAKLKSYGGGLGILNRDELNQNGTPNHSIDNTNTNNPDNDDLDFDMVMFSFDEAVNLTRIGVGWYWGDSDASVVAYTGGAPFSGFGTNNWSDILGQGWSLIKEKSNIGVGDLAPADTNTYSKHWLVGTFNSAFSNTGWTDHNDGLKLNGLTVMTQPDTGTTTVNAPATTGILFGFLALMIYRRKS